METERAATYTMDGEGGNYTKGRFTAGFNVVRPKAKPSRGE